MGITNSIRVRKTKKKTYYKMKFSTAVLVAVASAEDKKVPPRHPLQRLARLTEFSAEILNDWYGFLPSKDSWIQKFANNAERMERNFNRGNQRCGFYDENQLPHGGPERKRRDLDDVTDTTVKIQSREPNKSLLVSVNGLNDTFHNALVNVNTNIKSTE